MQTPNDFTDFLSDEEIQEILDIEAELDVDINMEEILSEFDEENYIEDIIDDEDEDIAD